MSAYRGTCWVCRGPIMGYHAMTTVVDGGSRRKVHAEGAPRDCDRRARFSGGLKLPHDDPTVSAVVKVDRAMGPVSVQEGGRPMAAKVKEEDWEEVEPDFPEVFKFEKAGDSIEGTLTAVRTVWADDPDFDGVIDPKDDHSGMREAKIYDFAKEGGELVSIWGTWKIDKALGEADAVGTAFKIEYVGKAETGTGGRTVNQFRILRRKS